MNIKSRVFALAAALALSLSLFACKSTDKTADASKFTPGSCCAKAAAAGTACTVPCCVEATKAGTVCKKCNPA